MSPPSARTRPCDEGIARARLRKAIQFYEAADLIPDSTDDVEALGDAYVTLCVHAGIAAADAICCRQLGRHAQGQDHADAIELLRSVPNGNELANALKVLLGMKTRAGYSHERVTADQRSRAGRRAMELVDQARQRLGT